MESITQLDCTFSNNIYTLGYIEKLRELESSKNIIAQKGSQELFLQCEADICIFGGKRGGSKANPYDTNVVTPFGYRKMGDLKVGSIISSTDGQHQKVLAIHEQGYKDVYKLKFIDGTWCECTQDHLWLVHRTCATDKRKHLTIEGTPETFKGKLWTTGMITEFLDKKKQGHNKSIKGQNLIIPLCEPVNFTKSYKSDMRSIPPYILGVLLGDGCMTGNALLSFTSEDSEIVERVQSYGENYKLTPINNRAGNQYVFKNSKTLYGFLEKLLLKGCYSIDKFIPVYYKYATVEQRLELVRGLMDTDGTVDDRGHVSFTSISIRLAEDLAWLIRSLGGKATVKKHPAGYKDSTGIHKACNDAYTVYINTKINTQLFSLTRKKDKCKDNHFNGGVSALGRRITGYEYVGKKECRCITVDNPNRLYLVEDFIVTHNTYSLLLEALSDVRNPFFYASLLRKEKEDSRKTGGIIDKSDGIYAQYGVYNKSQQDMTWNFHSGGKLKFDYYSDSFDDFKKRFQGLELSMIGVDEITHMPYEYFKYLLTSNRNAHNITNRFRGTCNPDPDSWVATFIDWWIGEDGLPIPERNGVLRYCFMYGDAVSEIYWGDSKQEVYQQAKERIDKLWRPEYDKFGNKEDMFIKSVTFIEGKLEENVKLMKSDPNYLGNLANQSDEQVARDLDGNWKFKTAGVGLLTFEDMENFFNNSYHNQGLRCVTCDVAFEGGDKCVMWYWEGYHARDVRVIAVDAKKTVAYAKEFLQLHGVLEENFTYDVNGLGQIFKGFMPRARPFNNKEVPTNGDRTMFENLKAECAYKFVQRMKAQGYSIEAALKNQKFSGRNYKNVSLENILLKERKAVAQDDKDTDKNWRLISKVEMKKIIGRSPDFMESFFMREFFDVKATKAVRKGIWFL